MPTRPLSALQPVSHGPVELENIVPLNMQPPVLLERWNDHYRSEDLFLTDRFGFIYDKNRQPVLPPPDNPAKLLDIDGFLSDRFDTSLLKSEAISPEDTSDTSNVALQLPMTPSRESIISESDTASHSTSDDFKSSDTLVNSSQEKNEKNGASLNSVKLRLSQLTDIHDSLQRAQKARWDEFMRKLNSEATDGEAPIIESGELFGVYGRVLNSRQSGGRSRWKEFKALVLGGVPVIYRSKIWSECCGAYNLKTPGVYEELVNSDAEPESMSQIELDLNRTMPSNVFFGGKGPGVQKLRRVLKAFSIRNPAIGYCQGSMKFTS